VLKKRRLLVVALLVVLLLSVFLFWFYFSKPSAFPTNDQLIQEINDTFPRTAVDIIQDRVSVDERHVFVPFITEKDDYGVSYWVWKQRKWRAESISGDGQPHMWKINKKDPSTYHFIWNMHPDNQLDSADFYLIRDRGYRGTGDVWSYYPRIQMREKIFLQEKSYGVLQFLDEWVSFLNPFMKVESAKQPGVFFNGFYPEQQLLFGWVSYDSMGESTYPKNGLNGGLYSSYGGDIEYVRFLNEGEVE